MRNWSCILPNNYTALSTKDQLRKKLRIQRAAIDAKTRQLAAQASMQILADTTVFKNAYHIACYLAQGSEFDLQPIIELIWKTGKKCYLPVLGPEEKKSLHFITYEADDSLQTNCHAIQEPLFSLAKEIPTEQLELVLVPLVGFDLAGHRLGSGSGYYDRAFAFLLQEPRPAQPCYVGIGYQAQALDSVPYDAWDVPLSGLLTEEAFTQYRVARREP
jgi:5-formyltetrahydrofolate cyclo-ligase